VRDIQHIQELALNLSQERNPRKIAELIDEIRDAAAAYIEATPNQQDSQSAAGGA
jgi:DNA replication initiation complex subunit (GINS family)